jgi:glycosyltransferase involved in cell wall biosynthesis
MKILLVCESSNINESGGRVVRYITKILKRDKNQVKLVVLSDRRDDYALGDFYMENDVEFLPIRRRLFDRIVRLFYRTREVRSFRKILFKFSPDVVHFASFEHTKPALFINEAKECGAKVVLQPWTMHFYCSQGFGFRNGEQCTLCANGDYLNALTKKCVSIKSIPSLIEKKILHKKALKANLFLSSNIELDRILIKYGIKQTHIFRFPIAFDYTFLDEQSTKEDDYYIFYGQANSHKGFNILLDVFAKLPEQKLKVYPMTLLSDSISIPKNVEVINGMNWNNGLGNAIMKSKAVLMPSLWSTSTEYALCEALLMKKAVVVFNVGVHKDIYKDGFNALVVEPNNINSFAKAILELDTNEELRLRIAENGYNTLLDINNPDKLYLQLMRGYSLKIE